MLQNGFPLLMRTVRAEGQRKGPHLFRTVSLLTVLLMLMSAHLMSDSTGAPGLLFFMAITWLLMVLISVGGGLLFATCVTDEKESGVLDLLAIAGVSPLAVLANAFLARGLTVVMVLLAIVPFVLLSRALGGTLTIQILQAITTLLVWLLFVAGVGSWMSARSRSAAQASFRTFAVLVLVLVLPLIPFVIAETLRDIFPAATKAGPWGICESLDQIGRWLQRGSIVHALMVATGVSPIGQAWFSTFAIYSGLGLFFGALARRQFRWTRFETALKAPRPASGAKSIRRLTSRCWPQAVMWKDFRLNSGGWRGLAVRMVMIPLLAWLFVLIVGHTYPGANGWIFSVTFMAVQVAAGIELLIRASTCFSHEYRQQTLAVLSLTSDSAVQICLQKILGSAISLVPYLFWEMVLARSVAEESFIDWSGPLFLVSPILGMMVLAAMTAVISLYVKWGAFPLALGVFAITVVVTAPAILIMAALVGEKSETMALISAGFHWLHLAVVLCIGLLALLVYRFKSAVAE